jgi:hypothetical protein
VEDVTMVFLAVSWDGTDGVLLCEWIFLHVMVGGGRGVAGPKELMGLVGSSQTTGLTLLPHHVP